MTLELFIPIIPRHQRLLTRLIEQFKIDPYGSIGWKGLLDEDEPFTVDQLFKPLVDRGLVEDLTREMGRSGIYFVHITKAGIICHGMGMMLKEPRHLKPHEVRENGKAIAALAKPPKTESASGANPYDPNEEREAIG